MARVLPLALLAVSAIFSELLLGIHTSSAAGLYNPPCETAVKAELEQILRENLAAFPGTLAECSVIDDAYFFRFTEAVSSGSGNSYAVWSSGEANQSRTEIALHRRIAPSHLPRLLPRIESLPIFRAVVPQLTAPLRYVNATGVLVGIESAPLAVPRTALYFLLFEPGILEVVRESNGVFDSNIPPIDVSDLNLAFEERVFQNLSSGTPPAPEPPAALPAPPLPPAGCAPEALRDAKFGERNENVENLQRCLIGLGYGIPAGPTGYYGTQTTAALVVFYRELAAYEWHGRIFGPLGIRTMKRAYASLLSL